MVPYVDSERRSSSRLYALSRGASEWERETSGPRHVTQPNPSRAVYKAALCPLQLVTLYHEGRDQQYNRVRSNDLRNLSYYMHQSISKVIRIALVCDHASSHP